MAALPVNRAGHRLAAHPQQRETLLASSRSALLQSPSTPTRYGHTWAFSEVPTGPDLGRYLVTKDEVDKGAFKTPTLRDVARRGPYMHDGSLKTLEEVVAFYNRGGHKNPWLSKEVQPLNLTAGEQADLVAFLGALTSEIAADVSTPPKLTR